MQSTEEEESELREERKHGRMKKKVQREATAAATRTGGACGARAEAAGRRCGVGQSGLKTKSSGEREDEGAGTWAALFLVLLNGP